MTFTSIDQSLLGPFSSSAPTFLGMGRNRVINGEMRIDQFNGGAAITSNTSSTVYGVDQFNTRGTTSEGVYTVQRLSATPPTGFQFYSHIVTSTASATPAAASRYLFRQPIETLNIRDFQQGTAAAKTFTLSFWTRSSLTGTFSFSIGGDDGGAGRSYVANYTVNNANTWEFKTITISGDTLVASWPINTTSIFWLYWDLGCGSNYETAAGSWGSTEKYRTSGSTRLISTNAATLDFTGVQLELGSSATPFEYRLFPIDLQLCQRYFEKSYEIDIAVGTNTGTGANSAIERTVSAVVGGSETWGVEIPFKVNKRGIPTMTFYRADAANTTGIWGTTNTSGATSQNAISTQYADTRGFGIHNTANNNPFGQGHWTADARL